MWLEAAACYGGYAFIRDCWRAAQNRKASRGQPQAPNYPVQPHRPQQVMPAQRPRRGGYSAHPQDEHLEVGEQGELMPQVQGVWEFDVNIQGRYYDMRR